MGDQLPKTRSPLLFVTLQNTVTARSIVTRNKKKIKKGQKKKRMRGSSYD